MAAAAEGGGAAAVGLPSIEQQIYVQGESSAEKRGIPEAIFIEDVEALCRGRPAEEVVSKLQELYAKYQYMQSSLTAQRASLKTKLPDITSALETVNHLVEKRAKAQEGDVVEYTYQLSETIWSKATAAPSDVVCLWLGANCMLEYTLEEAVELLRTNESTAKKTLKRLDEDMAFLRDQLTTTEVNIARTHNYGVKVRQQQKAAGEEAAALAPPSNPAALAPAAASASSSGAVGGGAGGVTPKYTWKQEREEVEVSVPSEGVQKADVKVTILADHLRVEFGGQAVLEGGLAGRCSPGGSTWTMTGSRVDITLEKAESKVWPSLFEEGEEAAAPA